MLTHPFLFPLYKANSLSLFSQWVELVLAIYGLSRSLAYSLEIGLGLDIPHLNTTWPMNTHIPANHMGEYVCVCAAVCYTKGV